MENQGFLNSQLNCRDACSMVYIQCVAGKASSLSTDCGRECIRLYHNQVNMQPQFSSTYGQQLSNCVTACGPSTQAAMADNLQVCFNQLVDYQLCAESRVVLW